MIFLNWALVFFHGSLVSLDDCSKLAFRVEVNALTIAAPPSRHFIYATLHRYLLLTLIVSVFLS